MDIEDHILLVRLKEGDANAFEKIYKTYYNILYAYILEILENRLFVEDVIEDIFVTIWEKRETLSMEVSFKSYLLTSARNASLDFIRKKNVRENYKIKIEHKYRIESGYELFKVLESDTFQKKELKASIDKAVAALPRKCRKVFKLSRYFKLKNKEIAHRLNISENTVEKHMGTALSKLREVLSKHYDFLILFYFLLSIQVLFN